MNLVDVKISRYPTLIKGIVMGDGEKWLALSENVVDYVLDGYIFMNKSYINQVTEHSHDSIEYRILLQKRPADKFECLNSYADLMMYLKTNNLLIAIGRHTQKTILVGYVKDVLEESFVLNPIAADLKKLSPLKIDYSTIRYISIKSDYLCSITNYFDALQKNRYL